MFQHWAISQGSVPRKRRSRVIPSIACGWTHYFLLSHLGQENVLLFSGIDRCCRKGSLAGPGAPGRAGEPQGSGGALPRGGVWE